MDYYSLKRRLAGPAAAAEAESVQFVEIPRKVLSAGPSCTIELQDGRGHRLRVELQDSAAAEPIAKALWSLKG